MTALTISRVARCAGVGVETALDMHDANFVGRAKKLCIPSVPAVVVSGSLAGCCTGQGPEEAALRATGVRQPTA